MKKTYKKYLPTILLLSVVLILCIHPYAAYARAGGGESFGGSFSDGGFSSGGSSGFFFLPFFFGGGGSAGWLIFIVLFFLLPIIIRTFNQGRNSGRGGYYQPDMGSAMGQFGETDLSPITQDDPAFSKEQFLDKVQTAFFAIQNAWTKKDLSEVRGFMTDALYQRFQMQIDDFNRRGITNVLSQIAIGEVKIVKVEKGEKYQSITCAILASMIDYKIDDNTQKIIEGNTRTQTQFVEYWTFMRSNGVKTKQTDTLVTKTCPNCGAPLDINEFGKCKYCGAYIISGDFDWILSDISQQF